MKLESKVILASGSPRRKQLLEMIGLKPIVKVPNIHEEIRTNENHIEYAMRNAKEKVETISEGVSANLPIIAADTIVLFDGELLEKPGSFDEACQMLQKLSGGQHEVVTGYAVQLAGQTHVLVQKCHTMVTFRTLSSHEIENYVQAGSPMDKAGAYGIQDDYGAGFVLKIEGSYTNVVGLPLAEILEVLQLR